MSRLRPFLIPALVALGAIGLVALKAALVPWIESVTPTPLPANYRAPTPRVGSLPVRITNGTGRDIFVTLTVDGQVVAAPHIPANVRPETFPPDDPSLYPRADLAIPLSAHAQVLEVSEDLVLRKQQRFHVQELMFWHSGTLWIHIAPDNITARVDNFK